MIEDFQYNQNFELVYEFIKEFGGLIENISIKMIEKRALKSNHYWMLAFIPKLKQLKQLTMYSEDIDCNADGYKFLTKAISYFQKNGGKLLKYQHKLQGQSGEYLYQILKCNPSLIVLSFKHIFLTQHDAKAIGKVLTTFVDIRELDLTDTNITVTHGKEIADGLIKAKKLEFIKLGHNKELDPTQIIYNLAFTPNVKYIDLQDCRKAKNAQTAEALYKLIKISVSIESLQLADTNILSSLTPEFFQALGESRTMKYLNFNLKDPSLRSGGGNLQ